jgi:collagenase-like PrtC family protease
LQRDLIQGIASRNVNGQIKEVYGKLPLDYVGGGRPAWQQTFVSKKEMESLIREVKKKGLRFNYLLNALCMDNFEFSRVGQKRLIRLLDWLVKNEVDAVTVAIPYLAAWLKKRYPSIYVSVSAWSNVNSLRKAKFWEDLGVDRITFPDTYVNRNFAFIKLLRKHLKCKIQLLANTACLWHCPDNVNHALFCSHASQHWNVKNGSIFDYYSIHCVLKRLEEPVNFIRSAWIRPEDIPFYENLGVDSVKLVDRRLPTHSILKIVDAYLNNSYQGNLIDLLPTFQDKNFNVRKGWLKKIFYLGIPSWTNPLRVLNYARIINKLEIFIDNKLLDGYLENMPVECGSIICNECNYCHEIASRVIKVDAGYLKKTVADYKRLISSIYVTGKSTEASR